MKKLILSLSLLGLSFALLTSCNNDSYEVIPGGQRGKFTKIHIQQLAGFGEQRNDLLTRENVFLRDFIVWSTDSAWSLPEAERLRLKAVRDAVTKPDGTTLLQKVIALEDVPVYMNNTYGGTIGGFISVAADMKHVSTLSDTYWGLRLDYTGTKFSPNGSGYAVIRYKSPSTDKLTIPYCAELGGTQPHDWPNGGGGFTTSKLADGGYPEYKTVGYDAPAEGAELYEVTPQGREILRSVFFENKWTTFEDPSLPTVKSTDVNNTKEVRNGTFTNTKGESQYIITTCTHQGHQFIVRAIINDICHLTTDTFIPDLNLQTVEKGIYGIQVPVSQISNLIETTL